MMMMIKHPPFLLPMARCENTWCLKRGSEAKIIEMMSSYFNFTYQIYRQLNVKNSNISLDGTIARLFEKVSR